MNIFLFLPTENIDDEIIFYKLKKVILEKKSQNNSTQIKKIQQG